MLLSFSALFSSLVRAAFPARRPGLWQARSLFRDTHVPILGLYPDGRLAYANRAWCDALGHGACEVARLTLADVLMPDEHARVQQLLEQALGGAAVSLSATFRTRQGQALQLEGTLQPPAGRRGVVVHGLLRDVTAQRAREAALEQARHAAEADSRARSLLLATVSHELRTPLNGVLGMAELLLTTPLNEEQRGFAQTLHLSGTALLTVVNDLLDFSKAEAGKLELDVRAVAPRALVADALALVRPPGTSPVALRAILADDVPAYVRTDEVRLRQVLVNLLANALKFTHEGAVELHVQRRGLRLLAFTVRDTGIGIPAGRMHRLFRPFSQAGTSTTRRYGGTGLGLAISKHFVEALGGEIHVTSEEGVGTTFTFTIDAPEEEAPAAPGARSAAARAADAPAALRVLLAEDNPVNQKVALHMLARLGLTADLARDGAEAVHLAQQHPYDVILMDVQMPELDGHDATRLLRRTLPPDRQPYVVALTANALPEDCQRCHEAGMDAHLAKPLRLDALRSALRLVPVPA